MEDKLNRYKNLILQWNKVHNLTGKSDFLQLDNNIKDSLYPVNFLDDFLTCLDIGSGAGFPAIPLAIYYKMAHFTLVEPRVKRASFLQVVKTDLNLLNVTIINDKVQNIKNNPYDLIVSRAVAKSEALINLSSHLADKTTKYLFYKGQNVDKEISNIKNYQIVAQQNRNYLYIKEL
jgi:16S rRNA (guanine527-N7)-methyltransferase